MLLRKLLICSFAAATFGFNSSERLSFFAKGEGVVEIDGLVTVNAIPAGAEVEVGSVIKHHTLKQHFTTNADGSFVTHLPDGDEYEIVVRVKRFPPQVIFLKINEVDTNSSLSVFADFTSPEFDDRLEKLTRSNDDTRPKHSDKNDFASKYGNYRNPELKFKVQVGAFKFIENFDYSNCLGLPKIIRKVDEDNITRFTMGDFDTYAEAQELLKKVHSQNIRDAFIIAYYKGEKKLITDLVKEEIVR